MAEDRVVVEHKPRAGPRCRVTFEPDPSAGDWEFQYVRIEEVYSAAEGQWRETGREHVIGPEVVIESARQSLDDDERHEGEEVEPDA